MVARVEDGLRSPFEREPELISRIGEVIVVWGAINHLMRTIGMLILDQDYEVVDAKLAALPGEGARLGCLLQALPGGEPQATLRATLSALKEESLTRNLIVHGGPLYGFRAGLFDRGMHIVNFREPNLRERFLEALPFVEAHLQRIRAHGSDLFDHAHGIGANAHLDEDVRYAGPPFLNGA